VPQPPFHHKGGYILNPISIKDWKLIRYALSYAYSNWDDVIDAFGEDEGYIGPPGAVERLLERVKLEANEARKLALCYYELYPNEDPAKHLANNPNMDVDQFWESIDCTYQNWLNRLYSEPAKALATTNWEGKVTKAYFKMIGVACPTTKKQMLEWMQQ
jgi:hypothetical protein